MKLQLLTNCWYDDDEVTIEIDKGTYKLSKDETKLLVNDEWLSTDFIYTSYNGWSLYEDLQTRAFA